MSFKVGLHIGCFTLWSNLQQNHFNPNHDSEYHVIWYHEKKILSYYKLHLITINYTSNKIIFSSQNCNKFFTWNIYPKHKIKLKLFFSFRKECIGYAKINRMEYGTRAVLVPQQNQPLMQNCPLWLNEIADVNMACL